jgi:hypothetical protein
VDSSPALGGGRSTQCGDPNRPAAKLPMAKWTCPGVWTGGGEGEIQRLLKPGRWTASSPWAKNRRLTQRGDPITGMPGGPADTEALSGGSSARRPTPHIFMLQEGMHLRQIFAGGRKHGGSSRGMATRSGDGRRHRGRRSASTTGSGWIRAAPLHRQLHGQTVYAHQFTTLPRVTVCPGTFTRPFTVRLQEAGDPEADRR